MEGGRTVTTGRRCRSLVDVVGRWPWNFENNRGGVSRRGIGGEGEEESRKKEKSAGFEKNKRLEIRRN